jgi:hypothetical protein
MTPVTPVTPDRRSRNRGMLLLIVALFLVPMLIAGIMRFTDTYPAATRQKGELLSPPADLRELAPALAEGGRYAWNPAARTWRILVPAPAACDDACERVARDIATVWQLFNKDSDRVDVLWWCAAEGCRWPARVAAPTTLRLLAPDPLMQRALPRADIAAGMPVYVVDPNGFVVLRYAPGSDLAGLRSDLSRLLKLK